MINYAAFTNDEEWLKFRAKYLTASECYKLLTEPKKKGEILSVGAKTYIADCVAEMLAPPEPQFYNAAMEHGNEVEPRVATRIAKELDKSEDDDDFIYTSVNGRIFFYDDEYDLGGTPDVIIRNQMICEVKCPKPKTHLKYQLVNNVNDFLVEASGDTKGKLKGYYGQMQLNMYLTKTDKCLFVSFDDRFYNPAHHYHSVEIPRDQDYIDKLLIKAKHAKAYKEEILNKLNVCAAV